jgi:SAM-dependent methyltransferase
VKKYRNILPMKLANITSIYRSKLIAHSYKGWLDKNLEVLDIGCGTGVVLNELHKEFNFKSLVGCDIENYLVVNVPFKQMVSFSSLPFSKNDFDLVMFNDVLHHTSYVNQRKLIKEAIRVAKVILIFELKPTLLSKVGDYILNKIHNPRMDIPYTYREVKGWELFFNDLKVKYEKKEVNSPFWYPFKHIAFRLTAK